MGGRARRLLICAAAMVVLAGGMGRSWAQDADADQPEGTLELTGGAHGCVNLDHRHYVINYKKYHFRLPPNFDARADADDDRESIAVETDVMTKGFARIIVTGTGVEGHKVCGASRIVWTATSNDQ